MRKTSRLDLTIGISIKTPEYVLVEFDNTSIEFMGIHMCNVHIRMNVNLFSVNISSPLIYKKVDYKIFSCGGLFDY